MNEKWTKDFDTCYKQLSKLLNDREEFILLHRNGFPNGKMETLEEVGHQLNLTRERVRQIECDSVSRKQDPTIWLVLFASFYTFVSEMFKTKGIAEAVEQGNYCITFEQCLRYIPSFNFYRLIALATALKMPFASNFKYKVIPLKSQFDDKQIRDSLLNNCEIVISKDKYDQSSESTKLAINETYHFLSKGFYIKNKLNKRDAIGYIIDKYFPEGYRISRNSDFTEFKEHFENEFGLEYEIKPREITTALANGKYCLIDRGTYLNPNKCATVPDDLLLEIVNYIKESGGTLFYETIYETYKDRLNALGINNWFYLKGVLDRQCEGLYRARKANLSINDNSTYKDPIAEFVYRHNGNVTIEEFREKFPGLKDYMLYFRKYVKLKK